MSVSPYRHVSSRRITRLPASTQNLLTHTQHVPTYAHAVSVALLHLVHVLPPSSTIVLTLNAPALRFSLHSNHALSEHHLAELQQTLRPVSALASVAVSTQQTHSRGENEGAGAGWHVRGGRTLPTIASPVGTRAGTCVDVWELFHPTPVRLRLESARPSAELTHVSLKMLVHIALANPHVAIEAVAVNGELLFEAVSATRQLTPDFVNAAVGCAKEMLWKPVHFHIEDVRVEGLVSQIGGVRYVSYDRVPCWDGSVGRADLFVVDGVKDAWRSARHRFPGCRELSYVLNVSMPASSRVGCIGAGLRLDTLRAEMKKAVVRALLCFGKGEDEDMEGRHGRKRGIADLGVMKRPVERERFADAMVCKRSRRPTSAWANVSVSALRPRTNGKRPVSAPSQLAGLPARSAKATPTAHDLVTRFRKQVSGWQHTTFETRAKASQVVDEDRVGVRGMVVKRCVLKRLRVVGQVERKFIMVSDDVEGAMYVVDQHAASERFLFERYLKRAAKNVKSVPLHNVKNFEVSRAQLAAVDLYERTFRKWGWHVIVSGGRKLRLLQVPSLEHVGGGVVSDVASFKSYLDEVRDSSALPTCFVNVCATLSCHSAVRFGDALGIRECQSVVAGLSECDNPFSCAHGRPSIVPIVTFEGVEG